MPVRQICVTGPECTGKTTLAAHLAAHLGTEWVPEAARLYAERVQRELTVADVMPIALEHVTLADMALAHVRERGLSHLVLDTDLVSTIVYAQHYYGFESDALVEMARARRADLYILCAADIPWLADGVRDRPAEGEELFAQFKATLEGIGGNVTEVRGMGEERGRKAVGALGSLVSTV